MALGGVRVLLLVLVASAEVTGNPAHGFVLRLLHAGEGRWEVVARLAVSRWYALEKSKFNAS